MAGDLIPGSRRTLEQLQAAESLARIFNPQATRQRIAAFERRGLQPAPGNYLTFAHYTTAEAALNILRTRRLWMRNTTCMADYREVRHGYDMLLRYFNEDRRKAFIDAFEPVAAGVAEQALLAFDNWWNANNALNIYVTSFSEHSAEDDEHGRLSMWRAFGTTASARVALIFKLPYGTLAAEALSLVFGPVAYLKEHEAFGVLNEVMQQAKSERELLRKQSSQEILRLLFSTFYAGVTCVKHEGFKEEREWRAVYQPQIWRSQFMELGIESVGGIPQHVHKIPLDGEIAPALSDIDLSSMLDGIIIGPSQYPWVLVQAFGDELDKLGVSTGRAKVRASGIPIRA